MRSALSVLQPYRVDQNISGVKLNQNESPYDIPPGMKKKILDALARESWNRYPAHPPFRLIEALARSVRRPKESVVVGNSSNEIILATLQTFCRPGDRLVVVSPGFAIYPRVGRILGLSTIDVPLGPDFAFDIDPIISAARSAALTILASPNNPTGTALGLDQIRELCRAAPGIVVIDEAYHEFHGKNAGSLLRNHPNLVLIRTFSKAFGLAGARLGDLLARPDIARAVECVKLPFSIGAWQQAAGRLILENPSFRDKTVERIVRERRRVLAGLRKIPGIFPVPSRANFVLFEMSGKRAGTIASDMARKGVLIRTFDHPRLRNHARITIGTPAENSVFLAVLRRLMLDPESAPRPGAPVFDRRKPV
jgi:histidinol-phosphate aminotransferase